MSYFLSFKVRENYIEYFVTGRRKKGLEALAAKQIAVDLKEITKFHQCNNVLFVTEASGSFPKLDLFELMEDFFFQQSVGHLKIAIVSLDEESHSDINFIETIALQNRFDFRVFTNKNRGKKWLLGKVNKFC